MRPFHGSHGIAQTCVLEALIGDDLEFIAIDFQAAGDRLEVEPVIAFQLPRHRAVHPPNRSPGTCELSHGRRPDTRAKKE